MTALRKKTITRILILIGFINTSFVFADTKITCGDVYTDKVRAELFKILSYKGFEGLIETHGAQSLNCTMSVKFHHEKSKKSLVFFTNAKNVIIKIQIITPSDKTMDCKSIEISKETITPVLPQDIK